MNTKCFKKTFEYTLVYYPDEKKSCTPQNDVHTSEDILTKMIKKFPLTLNFFWVVVLLLLVLVLVVYIHVHYI